MSIKVSVASPDLEKQLHYLQQFPEFVKKHFRPAVKRGVSVLEGQIEPRIPRRTGESAAAFGSKVTGTGLNLTGRVGWFDPGDPWSINVVEHGAKPHEMNTFAPGLSKYIKKHPGFSARGFMAAGYSAAKPQIEALMEAANDAVLMELKT